MVDVPDSRNPKERSALDDARDFAGHALYSAVEAPISGAYQTINKLTGDHLPSWQLERPAGDSLYARAGDIVGNAALFLGASKLVHSGLGRYGLVSDTVSSRFMESAAVGSGIGVLQPVEPGQDFWSTKLKTSLQTGLTMGALGGGSKLLESTGSFGVYGSRTLAQTVGLNTLSGAGAGIVDSFAHAGLFEGRLPTFSEVTADGGQYAAFGAVFGGLDWSLGRARMALPERAARQPSFAHETEAGQLAGDKPLPDVRQFQPLTYPDGAPMTRAALNQSIDYIERGLISERFAPGVKLETDVHSPGLNPDGTSMVRSDKYMVIDRLHDPVLDHVLNEAPERFKGITDEHQLRTSVSQYVSKLFNRWNLDGPSLEQVYDEMIMRSRGTTIPIGEFIRRGNGVCLQQAALFKAIVEELGMNARLIEGATVRGVPHVWTDVETPGGQWLVYDPAHQINGAEWSFVDHTRPKLH